MASEAVEGLGLIRGRPELAVASLSEEHGWLCVQHREDVRIGEVIEVVPNHACSVVNNLAWADVTQDGKVRERWTVDARGCMT